MSPDRNRVEVFRANHGGEFTSDNLRQSLYEMGIRQEFSDTKMPFQDGLPEVVGSKLVAMARAMMVRSGVPDEYWSHAVQFSTWIHNRVPLRRYKL